MNVPLLDIRGLHLDYNGKDGPAHALRGIDLTADAGEVIGIVGESGSGKSSLALAIMALLPRNAKVTSGEVRL
jgi:ABC-type glutathione transport system ATPase component